MGTSKYGVACYMPRAIVPLMKTDLISTRPHYLFRWATHQQPYPLGRPTRRLSTGFEADFELKR